MRLTHLLAPLLLVALAACNKDDGETDTSDSGLPDVVDTTPPTLTITDNVSAAVAGGDVTFTFTFSETVLGFTEDDIEVTGGTAGAFTGGATSATLVVSPPAESTGTITVSVAADTFTDDADTPNANEVGAEASQDFDTTSPVVETVLIDFEGDPPALIGFGGAEDATVVADPTDSSNTVGRVVKSSSAELWAGTTIAYCAADGIAELPFTTDDTMMSIRVWSPDAGIPVRLKVENSANGGVSVETETSTTVASAWETMVFDFANEAAGTAALNTSNTYDKISVFFNFGTTGADAGEKTYYLDDVTFLDVDFANDCPEITSPEGLPITFDDSATTYSLIGFGGAEDASVVPDPTDSSNNVARVVKQDTAELWAGTTIATGANESIVTLPITASATRMRLRVWTDKAAIPVRLKVETAGDPTKSVETEAITTVTSGWHTLTFDFANEAPGTAALNPGYTFNKASVFFDFGRTGADGGGGTYYMDDLDMAP